MKIYAQVEVNSELYDVEIKLDPEINGTGTIHNIDVYESDEVDPESGNKIWYAAQGYEDELQESLEGEEVEDGEDEF